MPPWVPVLVAGTCVLCENSLSCQRCAGSGRTASILASWALCHTSLTCVPNMRFGWVKLECWTGAMDSPAAGQPMGRAG